MKRNESCRVGDIVDALERISFRADEIQVFDWASECEVVGEGIALPEANELERRDLADFPDGAVPHFGRHVIHESSICRSIDSPVSVFGQLLTCWRRQLSLLVKIGFYAPVLDCILD